MSLEIIFLGNRGAGKTTILSVMSNYLEKNSDKFKPLYFEPDDESFKLLNKCWSDLLKGINSGEMPQKTPATSTIIEYGFQFSNGSESVACKFIDTPGGKTYDADGTLKMRVSNAFAVICVVDAVELMEYPGDEARDKCAVAGLQRLLRAATDLRHKDHMAMPLKCLFIPVKCEKYMHSTNPAQDAQALEKKFIDCYRQVLSLSNLTSLYLPIETIGCIEFSGFSADGSSQWSRCAPTIQPVNIYQPLCFAMTELLEKLEEQKGFWQSLWDKICSIFGIDDYEQYRQQLSDISGKASGLSRYDRARRQLVKHSSFGE